MKTHKPFLLFFLIIWAFIGHAAEVNKNCIGKNDTIAPPVAQRTTQQNGVEVDTQVWKEWKDKYQSSWQTRANWNCCERLVLNTSNRICEDKSVVDGDLKSCTEHTECPGDLGCLPWREDDMFNDDRVSSKEEKDALGKKAEEFDQARQEFDELAPIGGFCFTNMQCESYKCENFACRENKICRLAGIEDQVTTPNKVKCEGIYLKNNLGKCYNPNASYYVGLLGKIYVEQPGAEKCQYVLTPAQPAKPEDIPGAINLAIASTRSMEWLMSTISPGDSMSERDCVYARDYFRDKIKKLVEDRKKVIEDFNIDIKKVEDSFAQIVAAKANDNSAVSTLCDETTTKHDVATRKASGKDFLCYMHRRNELFKAYETRMKTWSKELYDVFKNYESEIKNWDSDNKSWTIGGRGWDWRSARTCRHWIDLWVGVITPKKLKKRWMHRHQELMGSMPENFTTYINTIDSTASQRTKSWHWMLDKLQPGHNNVDMITFVKSLRTSVIPENEFIHEPEMASSYELRGCIAKMEDPSCARYKKYILDLKNISLAQQVMYSMHRFSKYRSYYQNEETPRRRLISRMITDTTNLQNYYEATIELRDRQNACIDKVLEQLNGGDFNGVGAGLTEGMTNYYQATETNFDGGKDTKKDYIKPKVKVKSLAPMTFKLNSFKVLKDNVEKDNLSGNSAAGSGSLSDGSSAALASNTKALQDANAAAKAKGIDVDKMDKELREDLRKSDFLGGNSGGSSRGSNTSSSGPTNGDGVKSDASTGSSSDADSKSGEVNSGKTGAPINNSANGFEIGKNGLIPGSETMSEAKQDPTGISDEEKDLLSKNYERNKSQYKTNEDDSLFQVLSKTYVRNLDKIFTRKKKLEENAESKPTAPKQP